MEKITFILTVSMMIPSLFWLAVYLLDRTPSGLPAWMESDRVQDLSVYWALIGGIIVPIMNLIWGSW